MLDQVSKQNKGRKVRYELRSRWYRHGHLARCIALFIGEFSSDARNRAVARQCVTDMDIILSFHSEWWSADFKLRMAEIFKETASKCGDHGGDNWDGCRVTSLTENRRGRNCRVQFFQIIKPIPHLFRY